MFILGLISFFQVVFIPGFILVKYFHLVPTNRFEPRGNSRSHANNVNKGGKFANLLLTLVYAFAFSLLINYLLVFAGTLLGIYTCWYLYIVLGLEALLLGFYWYCEAGKESGIFNLNAIANGFKSFTHSHSLIFNLLFIFSFAVLLVYVFYFLYFLGTVFMHWDPVASWNRFALDWANNSLPHQSWRYPQLIPANWSVSYVLMQSTGVETFAKATMSFFSIAVLLLFLEMALRRRCSVYLIGLICYGALLSYLYEPSVIVSGYVDIAVSFFGFLAFHTMHELKNNAKKEQLYRSIMLAVLFASAAAVTKQAGLFILSVVLIWAFVMLIRFQRRSGMHWNIIFKPMILMFGIVLVITGSWYGLKEIQISKGLDSSMIQKVQNVHKEKDPVIRFGQAVEGLLTHRHVKLKLLTGLYFVFVLLGLFRRESWWATLFIGIPFTLIWAFFFSYDLRNLNLAVPFMAFSGSFGIAFVKKKLEALFLYFNQFQAIRIPFKFIFLSIILLLIVLNFTLLDRNTLLRNQEEQMKTIGELELNRQLYRYHETAGLTGKIATNYLYLRRLPRLKQFFYYGPRRISPDFMNFLESKQGQHIHYLLMPLILKSEKEVYRRSHEKIASGQWNIIFRSGGYRFIKIR